MLGHGDVVLGINCTLQPDGRYMADGAAALATADGPLASVAEERVSRRRYDGAFRQGVRYLLERSGVAATDLTAVAACGFARPSELPEVPEDVAAAIRAELGPVPLAWVPSHHEVHAVAVASQCRFERALVAVADGEGSVIGAVREEPFWRQRVERTSYWKLDGNSLVLLERDHDGPGEVGFGKAYSKATRYAGFASYQEAGRTMGLAPFGDPDAFGGLRLFEADADGRPRTTLRNSEDGVADLMAWFQAHARPLPPVRTASEPVRQVDADVARWVQVELEHAVLERLRGLLARERLPAVCGAGGVFLNSVLNGRIERELGVEGVFVPASPGDTGLALGAAAWWFWREQGRRPRWPDSPLLGGTFAAAEIEAALRRHGLDAHAPEDPAEAAAEALAAGRIVGWFQGASEQGPRALGNRSILADPRSAWNRAIVNHLVKHREWFRPLAPAVREERAAEYYDAAAPAPFMMSVAPATELGAAVAPACLHVDGSARLQTVARSSNPAFERVLDGFEARTGVPVVLNTSFNGAGDPIVEHPDDAIATFLAVPRLADLFVGPFHVRRG